MCKCWLLQLTQEEKMVFAQQREKVHNLLHKKTLLCLVDAIWFVWHVIDYLLFQGIKCFACISTLSQIWSFTCKQILQLLTTEWCLVEGELFCKRKPLHFIEKKPYFFEKDGRITSKTWIHKGFASSLRKLAFLWKLSCSWWWCSYNNWRCWKETQA